MPARTGTLSVDGGNVFAVLRSWLYREPGVAFRELVANGADAITKRRALGRTGVAGTTSADAPPIGAAAAGRVDVVVDAAAGTVEVRDDGIGMTAQEVDRYLGRVALSGVADFVARHAGEDDPSAVIGHFGVGFYSAFMLAHRVVVETLSAAPGAVPVRWTCTDDQQYRFEAGTRTQVGTTVRLEPDADSPYLAGPAPVRDALREHLRFLPVPVTCTFRDRDGRLVLDAEPVNDPDPVWRRLSGADPDEVRAFYREHFDDPFDPVLWIEVTSVDLGLRGAVFLRDTRGGARELDGRCDVYSRGVHVGHDLDGLVPQFLALQNVIVECDDLPLVVSRGGVHDDGSPDALPGLVREALVTETVLALHGLAEQRRDVYEALWPEIGAFVKYGVLTDRTVAGVLGRRVLWAGLDGTLRTLSELRGTPPAATVLYTSDACEQALLVDVFARAGVPAVVMDHVIDAAMVRAMETGTPGLRFVRLDADPVGALPAAEPLVAPDAGAALVAELAAELAPRLPEVAVRLVGLRPADLPVLLVSDEASRRTGELAELHGLVAGREVDDRGLVARTLVVNAASPLVARVASCTDPATRALAVAHLVDLALLGTGEPRPDLLPAHLRRSQELLDRVLTAR